MRGLHSFYALEAERLGRIAAKIKREGRAVIHTENRKVGVFHRAVDGAGVAPAKPDTPSLIMNG